MAEIPRITASQPFSTLSVSPNLRRYSFLNIDEVQQYVSHFSQDLACYLSKYKSRCQSVMQNSSYAGRHVFVGIEQKDRSAIHSTGDFKECRRSQSDHSPPTTIQMLLKWTSPEFGGTLVWSVWNVVELSRDFKDSGDYRIEYQKKSRKFNKMFKRMGAGTFCQSYICLTFQQTLTSVYTAKYLSDITYMPHYFKFGRAGLRF